MGKAPEAFFAFRRYLRHHHRLALHQPADEGAIRRRRDARDRRERLPRNSRSRRADQDAFAIRSQQAGRASDCVGLFRRGDYAGIGTRRQGRTRQRRQGRNIRAPETTLEGLSKLKPIVRNPGTVTAGKRLRRQ